MYIDCTKIAQQWESEIRGRLSLRDYGSNLAIVTSDCDDASQVYVRNKVRVAERVGINAQVYDMSNREEYEWFDLIQSLNRREDIDGIIVHLRSGKRKRKVTGKR